MNLRKTTLLALVLLLVGSQVALAAGPLINCFNNVPYRWAPKNIPYNPDIGNLGTLDNAAAVALVDSAFGAWQNIATAGATYKNAGALPTDHGLAEVLAIFTAAGPNGLSEIVFDEDGSVTDFLFGPGSGVLGFAGPDWAIGCTLIEGLAVLNGAAFSDNPVSPDTLRAALDVSVHEFGHYSNLAHTQTNGFWLIGDGTGPQADLFPVTSINDLTSVATMYPFYFGNSAGIFLGTDSPGMDDITYFSELYPARGYRRQRSKIIGKVFDPNGKPINGVNVIARNINEPFFDAVSAITGFNQAFSGQGRGDGTFRLHGLTPGAPYVIYVDEIGPGGFSTTPLQPIPGEEEFWNGVNESNDPTTDIWNFATIIVLPPGAEQAGFNIHMQDPFAAPPASGGSGPTAIVLCDADGNCGN